VGNVEQTSEEDFDRLYAVNVKGVYNCLKAGVPAMKQHGGAIPAFITGSNYAIDGGFVTLKM
jgi:NAD(P)-dependent dehydrogenase (short-subunit alcohol dehydrogenase family)